MNRSYPLPERREAPLTRLKRRLTLAWDNLSLREKGVVVVSLPLTALLVAAALSYTVGQQQREAVRFARQAQTVQTELQTVSTQVSEATTGLRGFLLTDQEAFLAPYNRAVAALPGLVENLTTLVQETPAQAARAGEIGHRVRRHVQQLGFLRRYGPAFLPATLEASLVAHNRELDALQDLLETMLGAEATLLEEREAALLRLQTRARNASILNLLLGLIGTLFAMQLFVRGIVYRVEAVEADARLLARAQPLRGPLSGNDVLSHLSHALADTARQLTAQTAQLRASETRLRDVITNAPVVLAAIDRDGIFTFFEGDAVTVLGVQPGELVGRSIFEAYKDYPEIIRNNRFALAGNSLTATVAVGEAVFETRYLPTFEGERVTGAVIVGTDVTERKQAEDDLRLYQEVLEEKNAELERANAHKDDFIAKMSHEFRTPLTAIIGFSELLKDDARGTPNNRQQLDYLNLILDSGHHILSLVNDLLDMSKIRVGMMQLQPEPVDFVRLATEALRVVENTAHKKNLKLEVRTPTGGLWLEADARKVKQMLYNLLGNAVKFTPAGGRVRLTVAEDETELRAEVTDTGPGIAQNDQERLFRAFVQLRDPGADGYHGTGLGLTLTKQLAELHGGRVWLRSELGQGSTFGFALPRRAAVNAEAPLPKPEELYGD